MGLKSCVEDHCSTIAGVVLVSQNGSDMTYTPLADMTIHTEMRVYLSEKQKPSTRQAQPQDIDNRVDLARPRPDVIRIITIFMCISEGSIRRQKYARGSNLRVHCVMSNGKISPGAANCLKPLQDKEENNVV